MKSKSKKQTKTSATSSKKKHAQDSIAKRERLFDLDIQDVNAYKERQDSYVGGLGDDATLNLGEDPGTFEN